MAYIKSRKHAVARAFPQPALTSAAVAFAALAAGPALAQNAGGTLGEVKVQAAQDSYKAESASPKFVAPLVDTPKTVTVIKKEVLQEQGATTLMEALRNTPGITMQLGENGNTSMGDAFQLRGFSGTTFVDGIRDQGAVTRDTFNTEQVEVVKGPAGADIGRGAAAGYINQISKQPSLENAFTGTATVGTGDKARFTADVNRAVSDTSAFRLNAMAQDYGVDGRNSVQNKSFGIAPSFAWGLNTPTRVYLSSYHLRQDNVPDGGIPSIGLPGFYNASPAIMAGARVNRNNFYGLPTDFEDVSADQLTARIEHDLGNGFTLRNVTRYSKTQFERQLTGVNAITGGASPSAWTVSRSLQGTFQQNDLITNQTGITGKVNAGGLEHSLSAGVELIRESQLTRTKAAVGTVPAANLYNPVAPAVLPTTAFTGAFTDGKTTTAGAYLMDNIKLNEQFAIDGGLRLEHYNTSTLTGAGELSHNDNLVSWKLGAVYKPAANGSLYAAIANSSTPPGGGAFALSTGTNSADNPAFQPQKTRSVELGTKWELMDRRLSLNAAVYQAENENQVSYDSLTGTYVQSGKTRVHGIELSAIGQITNAWQVMAGLATMHTRQLSQASLNNNTGVVTSTEGVRWSPDLTATLWTTYAVGPFTFGGGARYVSEQKRTVTANTPLATQNVPVIPSHWVADAMASYSVNRNLNIRLNITNLFDEDYIETLNNGGSRVRLGAPRGALLTATYTF